MADKNNNYSPTPKHYTIRNRNRGPKPQPKPGYFETKIKTTFADTPEPKVVNVTIANPITQTTALFEFVSDSLLDILEDDSNDLEPEDMLGITFATISEEFASCSPNLCEALKGVELYVPEPIYDLYKTIGITKLGNTTFVPASAAAYSVGYRVATVATQFGTFRDDIPPYNLCQTKDGEFYVPDALFIPYQKADERLPDKEYEWLDAYDEYISPSRLIEEYDKRNKPKSRFSLVKSSSKQNIVLPTQDIAGIAPIHWLISNDFFSYVKDKRIYQLKKFMASVLLKCARIPEHYKHLLAAYSSTDIHQSLFAIKRDKLNPAYLRKIDKLSQKMKRLVSFVVPVIHAERSQEGEEAAFIYAKDAIYAKMPLTPEILGMAYLAGFTTYFKGQALHYQLPGDRVALFKEWLKSEYLIDQDEEPKSPRLMMVDSHPKV